VTAANRHLDDAHANPARAFLVRRVTSGRYLYTILHPPRLHRSTKTRDYCPDAKKPDAKK
jgi:hypothetical protein